jgi:hypothetical protein
MPGRYYKLLLILPLSAFPLALECWLRAPSDHLPRVVKRGTSRTAQVVGKQIRPVSYRSGSSKDSYWIDHSVDGKLESRQVDAPDYDRAVVGSQVAWYADPAIPEGFSELEISYLARDLYFLHLFGLALTVWALVAYRVGVPLPGRARSRAESEAPASTPLRLPPPPRGAATPSWEAWTRAYLPSFLPLAAATAAASCTLAILFARLGSPVSSLIALFQGICALAMLGRTVRQGRAHLSALWRDGVERPGRSVGAATPSPRGWVRVEFVHDGHTWELNQRIPRECPPFLLEEGSVRVLVDPADPRRASVAPRF